MFCSKVQEYRIKNWVQEKKDSAQEPEIYEKKNGKKRKV